MSKKKRKYFQIKEIDMKNTLRSINNKYIENLHNRN